MACLKLAGCFIMESALLHAEAHVFLLLPGWDAHPAAKQFSLAPNMRTHQARCPFRDASADGLAGTWKAMTDSARPWMQVGALASLRVDAGWWQCTAVSQCELARAGFAIECASTIVGLARQER